MANKNNGLGIKTGWQPKEPNSYPAKKGKSATRVDLDPKAFEQLINSKGITVKVYRTMFCPNVKSIDGAEHEIDCPICDGSGYLDVRPIEVKAFLQGVDFNKAPFIEGMVDNNTISATFPPGIELQYFTLVELFHTEIYYERIKRSSTLVDNLRYAAKRVNVVIDKNGKEYFEGNDFCLNSNGSIKWKQNKGPTKGTFYSIHYEAAIQFRAVNAQHVNRFTQIKEKGIIKEIKLPEQWVLKKDFLVKRRDENGNLIEENPLD